MQEVATKNEQILNSSLDLSIFIKNIAFELLHGIFLRVTPHLSRHHKQLIVKPREIP